MAKKKKTEESDLLYPVDLKGKKYIKERGIPITRNWAHSIDKSHPNEFRDAKSLEIGGSIAFKTKELRKTFDSIRKKLKKDDNRSYIIQMVDKVYSRMWRIEDGKFKKAPTRPKKYKPRQKKEEPKAE